jgi:hypothetical protein
VYSAAAAVAPVRQTLAPCTVSTEPTPTVLGVTMPVHSDSPGARTRTPTVSERLSELTVIVETPPARNALTRPCASMLTSVGSATVNERVAPVTAFANSSSST